MNLHALIHAPAEGLGAIADWAKARGHRITETRLYADEAFPCLDEVDLLVVLGGAMNIYQHRDHPWLVREKRFIAQALAAQTRVLGVCLGAQLIADALGARVYQNPEKEIGWFPLQVLARPGPFALFPDAPSVLHWHGDTFELPPGAVRVAASEACENQAFLFGDRVVGLQFHLEVTPDRIAEFVTGGEEFLVPSRFVQSKEALLEPPSSFDPSLLGNLLDALENLR